jgi:putative molybdopterin biosynthesis protein
VPWQHVRPIGEDLVVGDLVLPEGHLIQPFDLGALIAGGVTQVPVRKRLVVAIIPTGTELVDVVAEPERALEPGNVVEYNSYVLSGLIAEWGGDALRQQPCRDVLDEIKGAIDRAVDTADVVLINAGSSAGSRDFTVHALRELGEVVVHGLATKPGKPAILAVVRGKPVLGVPGYPVSAALVAELLLKPMLARLVRGAATPREGQTTTSVFLIFAKVFFNFSIKIVLSGIL